MLSLAALLAVALAAQPPFGVLTSSSPPDPATLVQHKVARLTSLLTLTESQQSQATTIFTTSQTAITPIRTTLSQAWTSMQAAVKTNAPATIDQLAASIGTATGQITAIQNKADAAFYAILTADQQAKLNARPGPGFGGPGGPMGGGMGGRGPRGFRRPPE